MWMTYRSTRPTPIVRWSPDRTARYHTHAGQTGGRHMDLTSLLVQVVAGALGGSAAGAAAPQYSLGTLGNAIAGAIGGGIVGQLIGAVAASAVEGWVGDIGGVAVDGGVLMSLDGVIKNVASKCICSFAQLLGRRHIQLRRRAGTYEISIAINIVDTVNWGPILVDPESASREAGGVARVGPVPFTDQILHRVWRIL